MSHPVHNPPPVTEQGPLLLRTVQDLVDELRPGSGAVTVVPDCELERDLGLDSLARVELLLRVERAFGVQLPEDLFATAQTPRDLLTALSAAVPGRGPLRQTPVSLAGATGESVAPDAAATLVEALEWHAAAHPDRTHVIFYNGQGEDDTLLTYGQLLAAARAAASGRYRRDFCPGETAAIMLPTGADFLQCFFAVLLAGGVPVPIYPPVRRAGIEDHLKRQSAILNNACTVVLITVAEAKSFAGLLQARVPGLRHVVTAEELRHAAPETRRPPLNGDDLALLQYTSGSTGNPKGVMLSHANLLANIRAMGRTIGVDGNDVFVSWLPLYHDMGLIGAWLGSLYYAIPLVLMSPLSFLARPAAWLWAMHHYQATLSGGPNFAYALCVQKVHDDELAGLDLSRWRFAFNGAEPISAETMTAFCRRFAAWGFQEQAMAPVYGLAESSVGLAFPPGRRTPRVEVIEREPLIREGWVVPADPRDAAGLRIVACGTAMADHRIRIVDAGGHDVGERRQGQLQFSGPSATRGYYRNDEETARLSHGEWRDSGDLAYLADGEVFITGRVKEIIIHAGRNLYPYELEEAVGKLERVRTGCVAALGVAGREGTENLVIIAETRERDPGRLAQLRKDINTVVIQLIGNPPDDVVLVPPHALLKTSSGKLRRAENSALYERGEFHRSRSPWRRWVALAAAAAAARLRRDARTVVRTLYGVYAWLVFVPCALAAWCLVVALPRRRWRMAVLRWTGRLAMAAAFLPLRVEGMERLDECSPRVMVANHASYLDGLVLSFILPGTPAFVAKRELAGNLFAGLFLRRIGCQFVERFDARKGVEDTYRLQELAQTGEMLVFFAEGTFTRAPGLRPFRMGAFLVAVEAGLPVVPVAVTGTRHILPSEVWLPRRGAVTVYIDESIPPPGADWSAAVRMRDNARARILQRVGEPDLA
jgi:acyl carrier protein